MTKANSNGKQVQGTKLTEPSEEVKVVMAGLETDVIQSARLAGKAFSRDARINKYLTSKDDQGLSFFVDQKRQDAIIDQCLSNYGYSSTAAREAAIRHGLTQNVSAAVQAEVKKVIGDAILTDEQTTAMTTKAEQREKFIVEKLLPGMLNVARTQLGIVEDVKELAVAE